jgi:gas vesicle protein
MIMGRMRNPWKKIARTAVEMGVLFADPRIRSAVGSRLRDRVDDLSDRLEQHYDRATGRLNDATDALRGNNHRTSHLVNFLAGVGVGAGLGLLIAPASGRATRQAIKDRAGDMKDRFVERATRGDRMPSTGTEGY